MKYEYFPDRATARARVAEHRAAGRTSYMIQLCSVPARWEVRSWWFGREIVVNGLTGADKGRTITLLLTGRGKHEEVK